MFIQVKLIHTNKKQIIGCLEKMDTFVTRDKIVMGLQKGMKKLFEACLQS